MRYLHNFKLPFEDREDYRGHENIRVFSRDGEPEIEEILDGSPALASRRSAKFLGPFFLFIYFFVCGRVLPRYRGKRNTLRILYCYSLQQHIILSFWNDFHTHIRIYSPQKQSIVIPEMTSEANSSHFPLFLGFEHGIGQIYKFENSYKIQRECFRSGSVLKMARTFKAFYRNWEFIPISP